MAPQSEAVTKGNRRREIGLAGTEEADDPVLDFAHAVAAGLAAPWRSVPCRYLYDARGSALFEAICAQPEYYLTRTEASILRRHVATIAATTGPVRLVELGSGTSVKTQHLLRGYLEHGVAPRYVSVDVSVAALAMAEARLAETFPQVEMTGIEATYEQAFPMLRELSPVMVVFLGSTIGNFDDPAAAAFWQQTADHLRPGDYFLLGVDLVKEAALLEAAYNDAAGVTAAFTRNLFARMNRELGAGIDLAAVEHVAGYNAAASQIEIAARFLRRQTIDIAPLGERYEIVAGEEIRTEVSRKFRVAELRRLLASFGLETLNVFTDERRWFALLLLQRAGHA
ncbi:MAG: L-histidine N(alpha)-methyltransferase [Nitrospirota bacterium]